MGGSVPHPCPAAAAASVTVSSPDHECLSPAPPQNGSALTPASPEQQHESQVMTHWKLCVGVVSRVQMQLGTLCNFM